jgi:hypothetical protein
MIDIIYVNNSLSLQEENIRRKITNFFKTDPIYVYIQGVS